MLLNTEVMKKEVLLAFMIWAIDVDALHLPVQQAWEKFTQDAKGVKSIYTDPSDESLFVSSLVNKDPIEIMTDYTLFYAKTQLTSGLRNYGKYNKALLNYR